MRDQHLSALSNFGAVLTVERARETAGSSHLWDAEFYWRVEVSLNRPPGHKSNKTGKNVDFSDLTGLLCDLI